MNFRDSEIEQHGRHLGRRNMALKSWFAELVYLLVEDCLKLKMKLEVGTALN